MWDPLTSHNPIGIQDLLREIFQFQTLKIEKIAIALCSSTQTIQAI
jgi:hypothetical protein